MRTEDNDNVIPFRVKVDKPIPSAEHDITSRIRIHLECRNADFCDYVLLIDEDRVININLKKLPDSIRVTLVSGEDVPYYIAPAVEDEIYSYDFISDKQFVEIYDEQEDLIPSQTAQVLSAALRSGVLDTLDPIKLADGWLQRQVEYEGAYYSLVTHPEFDRKRSFGCSCLSVSGYFTIAGLTEDC